MFGVRRVYNHHKTGNSLVLYLWVYRMKGIYILNEIDLIVGWNTGICTGFNIYLGVILSLNAGHLNMCVCDFKYMRVHTSVIHA